MICVFLKTPIYSIDLGICKVLNQKLNSSKKTSQYEQIQKFCAN